MVVFSVRIVRYLEEGRECVLRYWETEQVSHKSTSENSKKFYSLVNAVLSYQSIKMKSVSID